MVGQRRKEKVIFQDLRNTCLLEIFQVPLTQHSQGQAPPRQFPWPALSRGHQCSHRPASQVLKGERQAELAYCLCHAHWVLGLGPIISPGVILTRVSIGRVWQNLTHSILYILSPRVPQMPTWLTSSAQNIIGSAKVSECRIPLSNDPVFHITLSFPGTFPWIHG